jgi:DNA (cytosine-5)-methyltransferase 1
LCSGYDGIGRGLERVIPNLRTIAHCEIEAYAIANLIAKMEEGQLDACPVFTDIKQFPFRELRGKVTILSAGFPCQPFSSAGKRQATEDPRHLWPWIANGVSAMRPRYCFFENVPGIITAKTADGESVLKYVLRDLEQRGYKCTFGIFSAEEVGAPHQRKRVFILAHTTSERGKSKSPSQQSKCERFTSLVDHESDGHVGNSTSLRPHRGSENCEGEQSEVLGERLESDEVGNTKHDGSSTTQDGRSTCEEQEEGRMQELERGCKQSQDELANPTSRQPRQSQARNGGQDTSGGSEEELGNPSRQGSLECGEQGEVGSESEATSGERCESSPSIEHAMSAHHGGATQWPARPGEEQYEWEEPRVTEAIGKLGRTIDGTQHRVDRLRLLGNGVVPQTAELAWTTLWKELISPSPQEK